MNLELPDADFQHSYDWSRISMIQGVVDNPFVGKSLVAGYGVSGAGSRPGFAWFFGRDSLWSALALDAEGDWATTRLILEFLARYQRTDGKIPHEVSQSAEFVSWFEKYRYPFSRSADATPLYLIVMNDYVTRSGDVAFANGKWDSLWKAYQFLEGTIDASGMPSNLNAGHGWIEQGRLLPVQTELYQAGLGIEAIHDLADLARVVGNVEAGKKLDAEFDDKRTLLNKVFWSSEEKAFSYAIGEDGKRKNVPSVLDAVPMWFGLLNDAESESTIDRLADFDFETDWGARIYFFSIFPLRSRQLPLRNSLAAFHGVGLGC